MEQGIANMGYDWRMVSWSCDHCDYTHVKFSLAAFLLFLFPRLLMKRLRSVLIYYNYLLQLLTHYFHYSVASFFIASRYSIKIQQLSLLTKRLSFFFQLLQFEPTVQTPQLATDLWGTLGISWRLPNSSRKLSHTLRKTPHLNTTPCQVMTTAPQPDTHQLQHPHDQW